MKVCELIEWLKRENMLADVLIEVKQEGYESITTFASHIDRVDFLGEYMNQVRIIASQKGSVSRLDQ